MSFLDQGRAPSFFPKVETEFDQNTRRRLDGLGPVKPQLSAEEVKAAWEDALKEDQTQKDQAVSIENGKAFMAGHPEFVQSKENIALMNHQLRSKFGVRLYNVADYEECFADLRVSNFVKIDKTVVAAQERQAAKERYDAAKARTAERTFNPNANYEDMSLEELRNRADEELSLAGRQEGANGF